MSVARLARPVFLAALLLVGLAACALPPGEGWVAMEYFVDEESGIRGIRPQQQSERFVLLQQSHAGTPSEVAQLALKQLSLEEWPDPIGTFRGSTLSWDLYGFDAQIYEAGPDIYHLDVGVASLASPEAAGRMVTSYSVVLVTQPEDRAANEALYETIYRHALDALSPLR